MALFLWSLRKELKFSFRSLSRTPGFSLAVILMLALGIGSVVSSFSLLNALLFREIGISKPSEIVKIEGIDREGREASLPSTMLDQLRDVRFLSGLCGVTLQILTIDGGSGPRAEATVGLSGSCFDTLGVKPFLGRLSEPFDDSPRAERVAVLTFAAWERKFGGNRDVLGRVIRIENVPFTVIGVTERKFDGLLLGFPPQVITPASQVPEQGTGENSTLENGYYRCLIFGRRVHDVSLSQANARLMTIWPQLLSASVPPGYSNKQRDRLLSLHPVAISASTGIDFFLRDQFRRPLDFLLAISSLVLLLCCMNVAGLLVVRTLGRQRDTAVRLALGATHSQIALPIVFEAIILTSAGALLGIPFTALMNLRLLRLAGTLFTNFSLSLMPDLHVFAFACAVIVLTAVVSIGAPCLNIWNSNLAASLQVSGRTATKSHAGSRRVLIVVQLGFTLAIVGTAATFAQTLQTAKRVFIGVEPDKVLTLSLNPVAGGYRGLTPAIYYRELLERVRTNPAVREAALSHSVPLQEIRNSESVVIEEQPRERTGMTVETAEILYVSESFFMTLGVPFRDGGGFSPADGASQPRVAIITESLARKLYPNGSVVGRRMNVGIDPDTQHLEIRGVVGDVQLADLHHPQVSIVFLNFWEYPQMQLWPTLLVRLEDSRNESLVSIESDISSTGREYSVAVKTLGDLRGNQMFLERLMVSISTFFCITGLIMVALGLYALLSFVVARRTREIGIRIALGAQRKQVFLLVIRETLYLTVLGIMTGIPIALGVFKLASRLIYGIHPANIVTWTAAVGALTLATFLATWLPCTRATRLDPVVALRAE